MSKKLIKTAEDYAQGRKTHSPLEFHIENHGRIMPEDRDIIFDREAKLARYVYNTVTKNIYADKDPDENKLRKELENFYQRHYILSPVSNVPIATPRDAKRALDHFIRQMITEIDPEYLKTHDSLQLARAHAIALSLARKPD